MILFLIGIIEMIIVTAWTKFVTDKKILASGVVTMMNILIWFYVLQQVLEDLTNWQPVLTYALGAAVGTMVAGMLFKKSDQVQEDKQAIEEKVNILSIPEEV